MGLVAFCMPSGLTVSGCPDSIHSGSVMDTIWWEVSMATLTIKNIPEPLVKRLKRQAAAHRRSLNFEVISYLEQMTHSVPVDADALLARARALRRPPTGVRLTDRLLHELKVAGRP
jgi:plasmid stability protein